MSDFFTAAAPDEAMALALRRIRESEEAGRGSEMAGLSFNQVVVNMGHQHPSTHGVLRLVVTLDGELVKDVIPVIGYLHRCKEKLAEKRTYYQYIPIPDRTEYVAGMNCEWGYVLTVEKLSHKAEATLHVRGSNIHADAAEADMYAAVDVLTDKLDRLVKKHKEKRADHHAAEAPRGRV